MNVTDFLISNGRSTGSLSIDGLVKKTLACASTSNYWSSTENSSNNAWNVNFSNGNLNNNNNKYNTNSVRAVAALDKEVKEGWVEAFHDCCQHKKSSYDCNLYRMFYKEDLWLLIYEVYSRTYAPSASSCFVVTRPKLREVFAAAFRDRIVHHWICSRLNPLFEARFVSQRNVSHNCRKGFGTKSAIQSLKEDIELVTWNYTREAWVARFDIRSFFMSIDTGLLWALLRPFIEQFYEGDDKDTLLYLTEVVVLHRPQDNCVRKSPQWMFDALPPGKSLFNSRTGVPIGNLPSQLFANFLMSFLDGIIVMLCERMGDDLRFERYVDDLAVVAAYKHLLTGLRPLICQTLENALHLILHPDKVYIQQVRKGVPFVGCVIKPRRMYLSNRTVNNMFASFRRLCAVCSNIARKGVSLTKLENLRHCVDSINSYLGFTKGCATFNIRRYLFSTAPPSFWEVCKVNDQLLVVKIKREYKLSNYLLIREIKQYGLDLRKPTARAGRKRKKARTVSNDNQLQRRGN